MKINDILTLKFPQAFETFPPKIGIKEDDNKELYIFEWNLDIEQPTMYQMNLWATELEQDYKYAQNKIANLEIYKQLEDIDAKSIRALRANDTAYLVALEAQAVTLRAQLLKTQG